MRSVRHATKEDWGAGQSSVVSQYKVRVAVLKRTGTHRSQLESLSVRPAAFQIKEMSVAAARQVCLMGVAPLFLMLTLYKKNRWPKGSAVGLYGVKVKQWCPVILFNFQTQPQSICSRSDLAFHHKHAEDDTSRGAWAIASPNKEKWCHNVAPSDLHVSGLSVWQSNFLSHAFSWVDQERWMKEKGSGWWPRGQGVEGSSWSHYLLIDSFHIQPIVFGACLLFCSSIKMHRFLSAISLLVDLIS